MKISTSEWVSKAEDDFRTLSQLRSLPEHSFDAACFHAQQAGEKYMKAVLAERSDPFPHTHDLSQLYDLLRPLPDKLPPRPDLAALSRMAVQVRYPGFSADRDAADEAARIAASVRAACRRELALDDD